MSTKLTAKEKAEGIKAIINDTLPDVDMRMGNDPSFEVQRLPTGVLPVDLRLDGGLPRGRFIGVYGDYSTMKSYVAYKAIARTQADGGTVALIDTEHAYDPLWLEALGGDPETLLLEQPDTGEEAVRVCSIMLARGVDLIVWDSITATLPQSVAEKEPGTDKQPARLAVFMSEAMRRLNTANKHGTAVLLLNQTRTNAGMSFGSSEVIPGGKSQGFYVSYLLRFGKAGKISEDIKVYDGTEWVKSKRIVGQKIKVSVEKSKMSAPFRESWFTFDLRTGTIDERGFLFNEAMTLGIIEKKGVASYKLPWQKKARQGKDNFINGWTDEDVAKLTEEVRSHADL